MKQLKVFLAVPVFLIASSMPFLLSAQDTAGIKNLSLQEAIDLSIKNSKQLKASQARIDEATGALSEAKDNKLPNASVSGAYLRIPNPTVSLKTKVFGNADSTGGGSPSINQALYGIASVSLPIYSGGRIRYGIESAKYLQQAATLDAESDKESVILNTIDAYTNLYKARVTVDVVKENLHQSLQRDSVLSRLEQNGLLARNDLLKAELQSSNIELSVLDAESNQRIATVNMNLMLGLPEQTKLITDSSSFEKNISLKNLEEYEQLALQNRKDILALSFRKKAATTGIAAAKSELYPSIALTGGYIAADIPHFITITNAVNIGVGVKYDIGSLWKTKSKIAQAQAREREITAGQAQLDDAVRLEVTRDYEDYLLSTRKIEVYEKAVAQATENYRITKNKYDNALVNTTDLLDANVSLLQSKISLAVAKADVLLAYDKLLETAGLITAN
ncbi:MAG TPA: TolC family protein [Ginsengibacter sp.]